MSAALRFLATRQTEAERSRARTALPSDALLYTLESLPGDPLSVVCRHLSCRSIAALCCASSYFNTVCSVNSIWGPAIVRELGGANPHFYDEGEAKAMWVMRQESHRARVPDRITDPLPDFQYVTHHTRQRLSLAQRFDRYLEEKDTSKPFLGDPWEEDYPGYVNWHAGRLLKRSVETPIESRFLRYTHRAARWGSFVPNCVCSRLGSFVGSAIGATLTIPAHLLVWPVYVVGRNVWGLGHGRSLKWYGGGWADVVIGGFWFGGALIGITAGKAVGHVLALPVVAVGEGVAVVSWAVPTVPTVAWTATKYSAKRVSKLSGPAARSSNAARELLIAVARRLDKRAMIDPQVPATEGLDNSALLMAPLESSQYSGNWDIRDLPPPLSTPLIAAPVVVTLTLSNMSDDERAELKGEQLLFASMYSEFGQMVARSDCNDMGSLGTAIMHSDAGHTTIESGSKETLFLNLPNLPEPVHYIVICMHTTTDVQIRGRMQVLDCIEGVDQTHFDPIWMTLSGDLVGNANAAACFMLERRAEVWSVRVLGQRLLAVSPAHLGMQLGRVLQRSVHVCRGDCLAIDGTQPFSLLALGVDRLGITRGSVERSAILLECGMYRVRVGRDELLASVGGQSVDALLYLEYSGEVLRDMTPDEEAQFSEHEAFQEGQKALVTWGWNARWELSGEEETPRSSGAATSGAVEEDVVPTGAPEKPKYISTAAAIVGQLSRRRNDKPFSRPVQGMDEPYRWSPHILNYGDKAENWKDRLRAFFAVGSSRTLFVRVKQLDLPDARCSTAVYAKVSFNEQHLSTRKLRKNEHNVVLWDQGFRLKLDENWDESPLMLISIYESRPVQADRKLFQLDLSLAEHRIPLSSRLALQSTHPSTAGGAFITVAVVPESTSPPTTE